jgi:POT family proton-dependent oligopeptide transporter
MTNKLADMHEGNANLRKVPAKISFSAWLVILLTVAERFTFYGLSAPLMNFMQNSRHDPLLPGGLGWGQTTASQVLNGFYILTQVTPIVGAIIADT